MYNKEGMDLYLDLDLKQEYEMWGKMRERIRQSSSQSKVNNILGGVTMEEISNTVSHKQKNIIDDLLDEYNDLMVLYNMFNDEEYKLRADRVIKQLKEGVTDEVF